MFWNGVAVNSYNFEVHNRGRVIGLVASMYFIGIYNLSSNNFKRTILHRYIDRSPKL